MHSSGRLQWLLLAVALCTVTLGAVGRAQSISVGYSTQDSGLKPGMVVALSSSSSQAKPEVERASIDTAEKIIGITTNSKDTLVTIASGNEAVYVQNSGVVSAYVSDINGVVKKGSQLSVSPLKGILMLSDSNSLPIGVALEDFPTAQAETQTITTTSGTQMVHIAMMSLSFNANIAKSDSGGAGGSAQDNTLTQLGRAIVGKQVSEVQVVIALVIFFIVLIVEGSIIYAAISSAITSLGRNPLARTLIIKELVRVLAVAFVVLLIGLGAVFAVLYI